MAEVLVLLGESADTAGIGCLAGLHFATAMVNGLQVDNTQSLPVPVRLDLLNVPESVSTPSKYPSTKFINTVVPSELVHRVPTAR